jgi:hypothetical protein
VKVLVLPEARRLVFHCPACEASHYLTAEWDYNGDPESPTFEPSILHWPPRCHSRIRDGKITFYQDCEHGMAGRTVNLPDIEEGV